MKMQIWKFHKAFLDNFKIYQFHHRPYLLKAVSTYYGL